MQIKELGHIVLYVTDLTRSTTFYETLLGFHVVGHMHGATAFSSGRTHHEMLLIEIGGLPKETHVTEPGLYHIGFKVGDSPQELKDAIAELKNAGIPILGATDHTVTHSVYIKDPDGNELELYVDVSDAWKDNPTLVLSPPKILPYA